MKLVAASRLRKAQTALEKNKTYALLLENAVQRVLVSYKKEEIEKKITHILPKLLVQKSNPASYLLVVFSSERGLCGSYNQNVAKAAAARFHELNTAGKEVKLICYGKKAYDILISIIPAQNIASPVPDSDLMIDHVLQAVDRSLRRKDGGLHFQLRIPLDTFDLGHVGFFFFQLLLYDILIGPVICHEIINAGIDAQSQADDDEADKEEMSPMQL